MDITWPPSHPNAMITSRQILGVTEPCFCAMSSLEAGIYKTAQRVNGPVQGYNSVEGVVGRELNYILRLSCTNLML